MPNNLVEVKGLGSWVAGAEQQALDAPSFSTRRYGSAGQVLR